MHEKGLELHIKKALKPPKAKEEDRPIFCQKIKNSQEQSKPIAYIDESSFAPHMLRTHSYARKGPRCYGMHDGSARSRIHTIGDLIGKELLTVSLFDETIHTEVFNSWVEQDLSYRKEALSLWITLLSIKIVQCRSR